MDYSEQVFKDVLKQLEGITRELDLSGVHAIPVSALAGDNVVEASDKTPWYSGPTLLELLESLPSIDELQSAEDPFRLPIQYVLRPQGALASDVPSNSADEYRDYRGYLGQISSGSISVGDSVELHPGGFKSTVTGLAIANKYVETAFAPQSISLQLADQFDLARGAVIAAEGTLTEPTNNISGELFWLDPRPLVVGQRLLLKTGTVTTQAMVSAIEGRRNLDTLTIVSADKLEVNDIGHASLRLATPIVIDDYGQNRRSSAFLLIHPQDGSTLAAGIHTRQNEWDI
jgi:sulfate adenylyltransferase subunit 1